jgi:hypothetical protein
MTTKNDEYNGWPNYETWAINAWLTNDYESYEQLMSIVQNPDTLVEQADQLKEWLHTGLHNMAEDAGIAISKDVTVGMYVDLLSAAFDVVAWKEIVRANQSGISEGQR